MRDLLENPVVVVHSIDRRDLIDGSDCFGGVRSDQRVDELDIRVGQQITDEGPQALTDRIVQRVRLAVLVERVHPPSVARRSVGNDGNTETNIRTAAA